MILKYVFYPFAFFLLLLCFSGCKPKADAFIRDSQGTANEPVMRFTRQYSGTAGSADSGAAGEETTIKETHVSTVFELPVIGASGYAAIDLPLYLAPGEHAVIVDNVKAGQGFTILDEVNGYWYITVNNSAGWIFNRLCMINIPDVIPSIVHDNTNTYSSLFRSSKIEIPNVTGTALYNAKDFNRRLAREEFIAPVLYGMAEKLYNAQKAALANGHTLIIYESFRPHDAHQIVFDNFTELINKNAVVRQGVTSGWFTRNWFIAPAPYNHQRGSAVDISLGTVIDRITVTAGIYQYTHVARFSEFPMQSAMHELSGASAIFTEPMLSSDNVRWRTATFLPNVTEGTKILFKYMTEALMSPLCSEWWHFNDLEATELAIANNVLGKYQIEKSYSLPVN